MNIIKNKTIIKVIMAVGLFLLIIIVWQITKKVPMEGDWQEHLSILSTAEFNGDFVTVKNVRNFRYGPTEDDMQPGYYDKIYDLRQVKRVWYVTEPFSNLAAHTFVSFEFNNEDFLSISIEARKTKSQKFSIVQGLFRTYPLIYIAADERDAVLMRANVRRDKVYVYPARLENPENARLLLVDMLTRMNELLTTKPAWYNSVYANCTSSIVQHVNNITPKRLSNFSWQLWLTSSADELALKHGLIDTNLSIIQAREKYNINETSMRVGDVPSYSIDIRKFKE
jgi:hypothetical protein